MPYDFRKYLEFGVFIDASDEDIINWDWQRDRDDLQKTTNKEDFVKEKMKHLARYRDYLNDTPNLANYLIKKNKDHQFELMIK